MVPSPTLYRLAANREYETIPDRVESHPEDVLWIDRYGSTCLHILCQARSHVNEDALLRAVRAIVKHRPDVVAWPNVATWTPLHFAVEKRCMSCSCNSIASHQRTRRSILPMVAQTRLASSTATQEGPTEWNNNSNKNQSRSGQSSSLRRTRLCTSARLVLLLLEACPRAVSVRTKTGLKTKTPFHIACEADADFRVLKAMLLINPSLATQPFVQTSDVILYQHHNSMENPLQLLWKNSHHHYNAHGGDKPRKDKMALLLEAAHMGSVVNNANWPDGSSKQSRKFRLLNGACSIRCPRDYFALLLKENTDQLFQKDEFGLLPLHYAVQNAEELESQTYTQFVIGALLEACPEAAAVKDGHGRLPLHVAADVGLTWHKGGVQELTLGFTDALRTCDPRSGLVPFLQSAVHAIHSRLHLSTTLELLLAAPEMVHPGKILAKDRRQQSQG